jgi:hypothetical protein
MYKQIASSFEVATSSSERSRERLSKDARNPNLQEYSDSVEEDTEDEARARRLQPRRERELPERGLLDLKSDAMEYFQTWRDGILSKIMDAHNSKDGEGSVSQDEMTSTPDTAAPNLKVLGRHDRHFITY